MEVDLIEFRQAMESLNSQKWIDTMNEEMKFMEDNNIWDLVPLLKSEKSSSCKWIFKSKRDSKGNVKRYKACLVVNGFT